MYICTYVYFLPFFSLNVYNLLQYNKSKPLLIASVNVYICV